LAIFWPLVVEFGSFLAVSGLDLAPWQKVDLATLVTSQSGLLGRFAQRSEHYALQYLM